mgnify:FL=1
MKKYRFELSVISLLIGILLGYCSCKTQLVHVPVEIIKTEKEYIDKWHRDSIYVQDSIIIKLKSDTVFIEKYKYLYRDKLVRDSIFITDSIKVDVPYPIEVVKEVNRLRNWQIILMVLGGAAIGYVGFWVVRIIKR